MPRGAGGSAARCRGEPGKQFRVAGQRLYGGVRKIGQERKRQVLVLVGQPSQFKLMEKRRKALHPSASWESPPACDGPRECRWRSQAAPPAAAQPAGCTASWPP